MSKRQIIAYMIVCASIGGLWGYTLGLLGVLIGTLIATLLAYSVWGLRHE